MQGFSIPAFFVVLRASIEGSIVMGILLSFVHTVFKDDLDLRRRLSRIVWLGFFGGIFGSCLAAAVLLDVWYKHDTFLWTRVEDLWEGIMSLLTAFILTALGIAFLKADTLAVTWEIPRSGTKPTETVSLEIKPSFYPPRVSDTTLLEAIMSQDSSHPHSFSRVLLFWVPFVTTLREALDCVIFLGGIAAVESNSHIPAAFLAGFVCGCAIGFCIFQSGNSVKLHSFLFAASVTNLYISAGMFAKAVHYFELYVWLSSVKESRIRKGPYYNTFTSVWNMKCCDPHDTRYFHWQLFAAVFGWTNSATFGSLAAYIVYWLLVSGILVGVKLWDRQRAKLEQTDLKEPVQPGFR
ncbi:iron permease FTR1 family-domain-containing protein [Chytriomyces cf. hyalinus JEL632]|nr:iron permease FTR1 family-domain-containing protein [Chytriomyces cf. hyalinus JEL632]